MEQKCKDSRKKTKTFRPKLVIASTEECADLLYAGSFRAPDEFLYYETEKEKCIVVSPLDYARACSEAGTGIRVLQRSDLIKGEDMRTSVSVLLSRFLGVKCWEVPKRFPLYEAEELRKAGIEVQCCRSEIFFPERAVKKAAEIRKIRESVLATEEIMKQFRQILMDSKVNGKGFLEYSGKILTSEFLRSELEGNFKRSSYSAVQTIFAHGVQASEPHNAGSGPIRAGEVIVADIFPRSDKTGYWGDMTRTYVKGKAPAVVKRAYNAVLKASETAKKMLRAGVTGAEVHLAAAEVLRSAGFQTGHDKQGKPCGFFHGLGHGVGLEIHEEPRLSPLYREKLKAGNVLSVEPGLYYSSWGGIRLEDLVVIRRDSCECLNTMEMELEL